MSHKQRGQRIVYIAHFSMFLLRMGSELPKQHPIPCEKVYKRRSDREFGCTGKERRAEKPLYRRPAGLCRKRVRKRVGVRG